MTIALVDAGTPKFENFRTDAFERPEVEKPFTVIPEVSFGAIAALHAIGSDEHARACVGDHQMVADEIELVAIEAGSHRNVEAFAQLAIEDQVAQALAGDQIVKAFRQPHPEERGGGNRILAGVLQDRGGSHGGQFLVEHVTGTFLKCELEICVPVLATQ